jgi:hypothetical protein
MTPDEYREAGAKKPDDPQRRHSLNQAGMAGRRRRESYMGCPRRRGKGARRSVPFKTGKSLPTLRKQGAAYAKRFVIEFFDQTNQ